jgi:hypothetical protein
MLPRQSPFRLWTEAVACSNLSVVLSLKHANESAELRSREGTYSTSSRIGYSFNGIYIVCCGGVLSRSPVTFPKGHYRPNWHQNETPQKREVQTLSFCSLSLDVNQHRCRLHQPTRLLKCHSEHLAKTSDIVFCSFDVATLKKRQQYF